MKKYEKTLMMGAFLLVLIVFIVSSFRKTQISKNVSAFQFMTKPVLNPGGYDVAPPATTVRSQKMSCHKCGGRKREYTN